MDTVHAPKERSYGQTNIDTHRNGTNILKCTNGLFGIYLEIAVQKTTTVLLFLLLTVYFSFELCKISANE